MVVRRFFLILITKYNQYILDIQLRVYLLIRFFDEPKFREVSRYQKIGSLRTVFIVFNDPVRMPYFKF